MMIEPSDPSDDPEADDGAEKEKVLRTSIPAEYRLALNQRKVMTGDLIKDMVQEALEEYLDIAGEDGTQGVGNGNGDVGR